MHLDLTAPDRLFTNFINYQQNKAIIDKKIKPGHSTWFHQNRNQGLHMLVYWYYSSSAGWNHFTQEGLGTEKPSAIKGVRILSSLILLKKHLGGPTAPAAHLHQALNWTSASHL